MVHIAVLCTGLLAAAIGDSPASCRDLQTYEALKAKAGNDTGAQVKLALWCEAHGLDAERVKHLARAMLSDPQNATARGLMGLISFGDRWVSADQIGERLKADKQRAAKLAVYAGRRARLSRMEDAIRRREEDGRRASGRPDPDYALRLKDHQELAEGHHRLGLWCEQSGLKAEALAHFTTAVHLDPTHEKSWRHLGYVKHDGRWMSPEQAAAEEREGDERRKANHLWEPLLRKWKIWLADPSATAAQRAEAQEQLASVTDRHAVPAILRVFPARGPEAEQATCVRMLGQIDHPASSRALAEIAVFSTLPAIRRLAIDILRERPRRDYAGPLVEMIHAKIRPTIRPVVGPGSTGALILDTPRVRLILTYDSPAVFQPDATFRGYVGLDPNGLPVIVQGRELDYGLLPSQVREVEARTAVMIAAANIKAAVVRQRMAADLNAVAIFNQQVEENNARVLPVLEIAAGGPPYLKDDEDGWHVWWYDDVGYFFQAAGRAVIQQNATPAQTPAPTIATCFAAGTPVRMLDGFRNIEAIHAGDQVLSQDAATGALSVQPVVFVHHNPPNKTLRLSFSTGESLVCSVYHRFWRANRGWAMARELKPGDTLRTLGTLAKVAKVEADSVQPLYNLDVAGSRTFFVGSSSLLVHDNTLPDHRLQPFDALPVVEVPVPLE